MSSTAQSYLAGLIGDGVLPSLTPPLHEAEADAQGLRCIYRPLDLEVMGRPAADVGDLVRAARDLGFNALNITHPCKQLVVAHLDEIGPSAQALGACNTVVIDHANGGRLIGHNTDVTGFAAGLFAAIPDADLTRVVQIGTGGAGAAVAHALLAAGAGRLDLVDLDATRREERKAALLQSFPDAEVATHTPDDLPGLVPAATGLVNATPVGMHHHPGTPLDVALLGPRLWVADIVYRPTITALISAARAVGCATMDGGWMTVGQAVDAFALMTGRVADARRMREHFGALVAAEDAAAGVENA